jgi:hypothetical protein
VSSCGGVGFMTDGVPGLREVPMVLFICIRCCGLVGVVCYEMDIVLTRDSIADWERISQNRDLWIWISGQRIVYFWRESGETRGGMQCGRGSGRRVL